MSVSISTCDNRDPYIYKTTDFGKTWTKISDQSAQGAAGLRARVAENPNAQGLLFAGTGNALYYSLDDGGNWTQLQDGLPPAPVSGPWCRSDFHDLVVSTYGRGFYILDDITPLEQMAKKPTTEPVRFFTPRPTYRIPRGENVFLEFELKSAPKSPVAVEITDAQGNKVRELKSSGHPGINRIAWDMHYDGPRMVTLRTIPPEDPHIWEEARFRGMDSRPVTHWGMGRAPTRWQCRASMRRG